MQRGDHARDVVLDVAAVVGQVGIGAPLRRCDENLNARPSGHDPHLRARHRAGAAVVRPRAPEFPDELAAEMPQHTRPQRLLSPGHDGEQRNGRSAEAHRDEPPQHRVLDDRWRIERTREWFLDSSGGRGRVRRRLRLRRATWRPGVSDARTPPGVNVVVTAFRHEPPFGIKNLKPRGPLIDTVARQPPGNLRHRVAGSNRITTIPLRDGAQWLLRRYQYAD